jgi:hypothetical protein
MWERSPTARLIWGIAFFLLLIGLGNAAAGTGKAGWIAAFLLVVAIGFAQLLVAGPTEGRLWDSPLTKLLYAYIAVWGLYVFGKGAIETGSAAMVLLFVALAALITLQLAVVVRELLSARAMSRTPQ